LEQNAEPTWDGLLKPLEEIDVPFAYAWGPVSHLLSVKNSDALRQAHEVVLPKVIAFGLRVQQSRPLYDALCALRDGDGWNALDGAQQRCVELKIRDAEQAGVGLEGEDKERFNEIARELSQLSTDFSNHVLDATKAYELIIQDQSETEGWPTSLRQVAAQSYAQANEGSKASPDEGPWRITLDFPSFMPFMQHHRVRAQREAIYRAYVGRASSGEWDNSPLIDRILTLRKEQSALLGFSCYADCSLASKMAPDTAAVEQMIAELKSASDGPMRADFAEIESLARENGQEEPLLHWDTGFWSERLREARFDYTDDQLRPYFPLPKVLDGLFGLSERLFGIQIERADASTAHTWHGDVQYFHVLRNGQPIASF
ncbi:MAG: M3 family metallopeptidase, partial [Pseudomonadota bacterium]|nr:M3 family metallopeptidase [Pseudomonadota bacterium]